MSGQQTTDAEDGCGACGGSELLGSNRNVFHSRDDLNDNNLFEGQMWDLNSLYILANFLPFPLQYQHPTGRSETDNRSTFYTSLCADGENAEKNESDTVNESLDLIPPSRKRRRIVPSNSSENSQSVIVITGYTEQDPNQTVEFYYQVDRNDVRRLLWLSSWFIPPGSEDQVGRITIGVAEESTVDESTIRHATSSMEDEWQAIGELYQTRQRRRERAADMDFEEIFFSALCDVFPAEDAGRIECCLLQEKVNLPLFLANWNVTCSDMSERTREPPNENSLFLLYVKDEFNVYTAIKAYECLRKARSMREVPEDYSNFDADSEDFDLDTEDSNQSQGFYVNVTENNSETSEGRRSPSNSFSSDWGGW